MRPSLVVGALVLAATGLLMPQAALTQARGAAPPRKEATRKPEDAAEQLAQLTGWLRALKGQYALQTSSLYAPQILCRTSTGPNGPCIEWADRPTAPAAAFKGEAECFSIEAGPGLKCFFTTEAPVTPGMPMVVLLGIQSREPAIRVLSVDVHGFSTQATGRLKNGSLRLDTPCPNPNCARLVEIKASTDWQVIELQFSRGRVPILPGADFPTEKLIVMRRQAPATAAPSSGMREP